MAVALSCMSIHAEEKTESSFYFGIGGGYHLSNISYSNLDKAIYPAHKQQGSGVFDFFLQYEFGRKKQFGVRLEFDFLKRGGTLNNIYGGKEYDGLYEQQNISDIFYDLRSSYTDIRLPLIYQFCGSRSVVRPYIYVAPMVSFATGGQIKTQTDFNDGSYGGCKLDITKANMRQAYFGGAVGVGLKYDLNLYGHPFYLGLEVNYQAGFTDTYSKAEKNGEVIVKDGIFNYAYDISGTRKFNGFEIKGSLSIPFSIFCKKKASPVAVDIPAPVYTPAPVYVPEPQPAPAVEPEPVDLPCRSIDEISDMIQKGQDIHGVTFCSIDDIRFETGKSTLQPSSYVYLNKLASILKQTGVEIEVMGHTDNTGTHEFNMQLSKDRALAVVNYLKKLGVDGKLLSYSYYGETRPIRENDSDENRSINRRVEFAIK